MDMEDNRNTTALCRAGCGFYGNQAFDGMCSKCYKDAVQRKQNAPVTSGRSTPSAPTQADCGTSSIVDDVSAAMTQQTTPSVETATPTVTVPAATPIASSLDETTGTASVANDKDEDSLAGDSATATPVDGSPGGSAEKKSKRNRCSTCKKKVGLTGFECRCGGLYCSLHRYSDKHDCQFDYKEMAQEQIRRNNPVVVGAKIQKL